MGSPGLHPYFKFFSYLNGNRRGGVPPGARVAQIAEKFEGGWGTPGVLFCGDMSNLKQI